DFQTPSSHSFAYFLHLQQTLRGTSQDRELLEDLKVTYLKDAGSNVQNKAITKVFDRHQEAGGRVLEDRQASGSRLNSSCRVGGSQKVRQLCDAWIDPGRPFRSGCGLYRHKCVPSPYAEPHASPRRETNAFTNIGRVMHRHTKRTRLAPGGPRRVANAHHL